MISFYTHCIREREKGFFRKYYYISLFLYYEKKERERDLLYLVFIHILINIPKDMQQKEKKTAGQTSIHGHL